MRGKNEKKNTFVAENACMQYTLSNDNFEVIVDSKGCEIVSVIRKSDNKQIGRASCRERV